MGDFDVSLLDSMMKLLVSNAIVPFVNYYLANGVSLPTVKNVAFVNPQIVYGEGFFSVATDVTYSPSTLLRPIPINL